MQGRLTTKSMATDVEAEPASGQIQACSSPAGEALTRALGGLARWPRPWLTPERLPLLTLVASGCPPSHEAAPKARTVFGSLSDLVTRHR